MFVAVLVIYSMTLVMAVHREIDNREVIENKESEVAKSESNQRTDVTKIELIQQRDKFHDQTRRPRQDHQIAPLSREDQNAHRTDSEIKPSFQQRNNTARISLDGKLAREEKSTEEHHVYSNLETFTQRKTRSELTSCDEKQKHFDWQCYAGYRYKCAWSWKSSGYYCKRTWKRNVDTEYWFYDAVNPNEENPDEDNIKRGYKTCKADSECKDYWKQLEEQTPDAIPCVNKWRNWKNCYKGIRYGCKYYPWQPGQFFCFCERSDEGDWAWMKWPVVDSLMGTTIMRSIPCTKQASVRKDHSYCLPSKWSKHNRC